MQRVVRADELRAALASSVLAPSTLVWREGMSGWVPAFTVPELGASDSSIQALPGDGTTDIAPAPKIEAPPEDLRARAGYPAVHPPPLVVAGKAGAHEAGSVADTGRPTPTQLLAERSDASRSNGKAAPRPAAGQDAGVPFKISAAPKPIAAARPAGKLDAGAGAPKAGARPTTAGGWKKPEIGKPKTEPEDVTLVADASDAFKVKAPGEGPPNGATPGTPNAGGASKEPSRVAASLASRRPVTRTAVLPGNEEAPRPAAGRPASVVPAAPKRPGSGVPPPPVQIAPRRSPSAAPKASPSSPAPDPKGFRTTAFMGSSGSSAPTAGTGGSVSVPAPPRVPNVARPVFTIAEHTSTDSTGVLPLGGKYAAEPAPPERAPQPSFVDGAPAFAERTPSFPDGAAAHEASRGAPPPDVRAPLRSRPPPRLDEGAARAVAAHGGSPVASYPPAPQPIGGAPFASEGVPYSAPPPPLALAEPSIGEIRTTGALPLVHPKRSPTAAQQLVPPPAGYSQPPPAGYSQPPPAGYSQPPPAGYSQPPPAYSQPPPAHSQPPPPTTTPPPPLTTPPPSHSMPPPGDGLDALDPAAQPGNPIVVPMSSLFGAGAILIAMAVTAFFMGRCSVGPGPVAAPARAAFAALPRLARVALPSAPKPCWMAKQPVRWAPAVLQSVPVDVAPSPKGVVVAYARDAHEPATVEVDFAAGAFDDKAADKRDGDIVRVFAPRDGSGLLVTTKSDAGPLAPYVWAPGASPFVIGLAGRGTSSPTVALADKPEGEPATLWTVPQIEDDKGLEAARVLGAGPSIWALVFRRSGGILAGYVGDGRKPSGVLAPVAGSGGSVGRPSIGSNKREVAVVFGDRQNSDAPWEIRVGHAPLGTMPRDTVVVPLPKGGPGGDAFAPDVAGTPDGRWVLVWTEGKTGAYAVRAQTFGADWKPLGDPIAISPPAGNYGQAVVGVAGNYVTTMFLSRASSGSYELWGAVLQCGS